MGDGSIARQQLPAWEPPEETIDPRTPHAARVYDYWLGGKDNYAADRMVADQIADVYPWVPLSALANRFFHHRAAAWMVSAGIRQFLDVGCGLPTREPTHQIVRTEATGARVVYADHDPMVVAHARALLASSPGVAALRGDVRDPQGILASRQARTLLRPGEPTGLLLTALLHVVPEHDDPAALVERFLTAMAPGSCVAISHGSIDNLPPQAAGPALRIYERVREPATMRTKVQVRRLFGDLELLPPWKGASAQIVTVDRWLGPDVPRPLTGSPPLHEIRGGEALWAGVARKPSTTPGTACHRPSGSPVPQGSRG